MLENVETLEKMLDQVLNSCRPVQLNTGLFLDIGQADARGQSSDCNYSIVSVLAFNDLVDGIGRRCSKGTTEE